jgi:hypothetical protein
MILHCERARLKSRNRVTRGTLSSISTLEKLSLMGISMTIRTLIKSQMLVEVSPLVTSITLYFGVLSRQGILRFTVIEAGLHRSS